MAAVLHFRILGDSLLLRAGRVVPVSVLVGLLRDSDPPADARAAVQTYVARPRRLLGRRRRHPQPQWRVPHRLGCYAKAALLADMVVPPLSIRGGYAQIVRVRLWCRHGGRRQGDLAGDGQTHHDGRDRRPAHPSR